MNDAGRRRTHAEHASDKLHDVYDAGLARVEVVDLAVDVRDRDEEEVCRGWRGSSNRQFGSRSHDTTE